MDSSWQVKCIKTHKNCSFLFYSAAIGSVAGVGIGIYKRQPPLRWFTSAGINCAIATCCFCGIDTKAVSY